MKKLRKEVSKLEIPESVKQLPIDKRGYPVPWFVAKIDGEYDFRVTDPEKWVKAVEEKLCWVCGQKLGRQFTFVLGPMCLVNMVNSEPPSHYECAKFAAQACPFLIQKQVKYNETNLPEGVVDPGGLSIKRQPGAIVLYTTDSYRVFNAGNGWLIDVGKTIAVEWWSHGRLATYDEAKESIESGIPILKEALEQDVKNAKSSYKKVKLKQEFGHSLNRAMKLLPGEKIKKPLFGSAAKRYVTING